MIPRHSTGPIRTAFVAFGAAVLVLSSLILIFQAGSAIAANVSWVGPDGNLYRASPDGVRTEQVTDNATTESGYLTPSQRDDGTIVAIRKASSSAFAYFIRPSDGKQIDAWSLPKTGAGSFVPFNGGTISPEGGMFVYDWHYFDCMTNPCTLNQRVSFIAGPATTNPCLINCHVGYVRPRWIPGTPFAGFVDTSFNRIWVQKEKSAEPTGWLGFNDPNAGDIESFDVSGNGRTVLEVTPEGGDDAEFSFWDNNGTPPAGRPAHRCSVANIAKAPAFPRFSPDGSMITWQDRGSVYVAAVPAVTDGSSCNLDPVVRIGSGKQPAWGKATIPNPDPDPDPNPDPDPKPDPDPDPNPDPKPDPDPNPIPNRPVVIKSVKAGPPSVRVRAGRSATLTATVTVANGKADELRLCPSVAKKFRKLVRLPACRTLREVGTVGSRSIAFRVGTTRKARGRVPVRLTASGTDLTPRSTTAILKVSR
ncbi:MAG: hypothetical protein M9938_10840 [Solirubrobacterales bacterium]|nr:hypothetical protein [Solirubrobacterales bacterium]